MAGLRGSLHHGDVRHHLLGARALALLQGRATWFVPIRTPDGGFTENSRHMGVLHALPSGLLLAAVVVLIGLGAAVLLARRDVT